MARQGSGEWVEENGGGAAQATAEPSRQQMRPRRIRVASLSSSPVISPLSPIQRKHSMQIMQPFHRRTSSHFSPYSSASSQTLAPTSSIAVRASSLGDHSDPRSDEKREAAECDSGVASPRTNSESDVSHATRPRTTRRRSSTGMIVQSPASRAAGVSDKEIPTMDGVDKDSNEIIKQAKAKERRRRRSSSGLRREAVEGHVVAPPPVSAEVPSPPESGPESHVDAFTRPSHRRSVLSSDSSAEEHSDMPGLTSPTMLSHTMSMDSNPALLTAHLHASDPPAPSVGADTGTTGDLDAESYATEHGGKYKHEEFLTCAEVRLSAASGQVDIENLVTHSIPKGKVVLTVVNRVLAPKKLLMKDRYPIFVMSLEGLFDHDQGKCVEEPMPVLYAKRRRKKNGKAAYDMATTMENLHAGILVGKVNSSFTKRAYSVFDGGDKPRKGQTAQQPTMRKEMASVKMTANSYRKYGPRELVAACVDPETGETLHFVNRIPKWDHTMKQHTLKFYNRATQSSVKNFLLVQDGAMYQDLPHNLLHGKRGKHSFSLDVRYPLTLHQALGVALCSFENAFLENTF